MWYNILMKIRLITDIKNLKDKRVLVRADFNVSVKNGKVVDNFRLKKALPTIKYLLDKGAKIILVSHLGRPTPGKFDKKLSLEPIAKELSRLLKRRVTFISDVQRISGKDSVSFKILSEIYKASEHHVTILENIRFIKGEEENDLVVAKKLASTADLFVMDGFAVAHRDCSSVTGVAEFLPAYGGLLVGEEVQGLDRAILKPKKPLVVVLGGAKCETKIPVLKNLLPRATNILVGGGIANTFLWAKGYNVGNSLVDKNYRAEILKICSNKKVITPIDVVVGDIKGKNTTAVAINSKFKVANKKLGIYDIGPQTVNLFSKFIRNANTLIINGALGYFEVKPYHHGTFALSCLVANRSKGKAFGVAGGGETVEVLDKLEVMNNMDLVSTGGGAMLEYLSGKKLPGLQILKK